MAKAIAKIDPLAERIARASMSVKTADWASLSQEEQLLLLATVLKTSDFGACGDDGWLLRPVSDILWELFGLRKGADQRSFKAAMAASPLFETNGVRGTYARQRVVVTPELKAVLAKRKAPQKKGAVTNTESISGTPASPNLAPLPTRALTKADMEEEARRVVQIDPPTSGLEDASKLFASVGHTDLLVDLLADRISGQLEDDLYVLGKLGEELIRRAKH